MVRSVASLPRSRASKPQQRSGARQEAERVTGGARRLFAHRDSGIVAISLAGDLQGVDALPSTSEAGFEMRSTGHPDDRRQEGQPDGGTRIRRRAHRPASRRG